MGNLVQKHGEVISNDYLSKITLRYHTITRAVNREFWNSVSDVSHSLYVGSYGRGTAIDASDVDVLIELPQYEYTRFDTMKGNGQSRLLQAVKNSIILSYPNSRIRADGQVVVIDFSDGIKFEVLPAFRNNRNNSFLYPDSNMGGNWRSTNPKAEQLAMREKNKQSNGLFFDTCKHIRRIKNANFSSYHLSGIVIDSFVYAAMGSWQWTPPDSYTTSSQPGTYENVLLEYYNQKSYNGWANLQLFAPGSNQIIETDSSMQCLGKVLNSMVN